MGGYQGRKGLEKHNGNWPRARSESLLTAQLFCCVKGEQMKKRWIGSRERKTGVRRKKNPLLFKTTVSRKDIYRAIQEGKSEKSEGDREGTRKVRRPTEKVNNARRCAVSGAGKRGKKE